MTLSAQATQAAGSGLEQKPTPLPLPLLGRSDEAAAGSEAAPEEAEANGDGLTDEDRAMIAALEQRDRAVHTHEAAHQAAGGGLVGAASFTYQVGPDGKSYAIGGECPIQMPGGQTPAEIVAIAQRVRAAALAPADPSPQDLAVANAATQMETQARAAASQAVAQRPAPSAKAPTARPTAGSRGEQIRAPSPESSASSAPLRDVDVQLLMDVRSSLAAPPSALFARRAMAAYVQTAQ